MKHINIEGVRSFDIPVEEYMSIKSGADYVTPGGEVIANELLTYAPVPPKTYAYCSDTIFDPGLAAYIAGCDMLYHEATYMKNLEDRAQLYYHSTAEQAARVALQAGAGHLLLGHFSSRYDHLKPLLDEARAVFPNSSLALEGEKFVIRGMVERV